MWCLLHVTLAYYSKTCKGGCDRNTPFNAELWLSQERGIRLSCRYQLSIVTLYDSDPFVWEVAVFAWRRNLPILYAITQPMNEGSNLNCSRCVISLSKRWYESGCPFLRYSRGVTQIKKVSSVKLPCSLPRRRPFTLVLRGACLVHPRKHTLAARTIRLLVQGLRASGPSLNYCIFLLFLASLVRAIPPRQLVGYSGLARFAYPR